MIQTNIQAWTSRSPLETLSNLDRNIQELLQVHSPRSPDERRFQNAHDHQLKQCKTFRSFIIDVGIHTLGVRGILPFLAYIEYIKSSKLSSSHPQDTSDPHQTPREKTVECLSLIDQIIGRSGGSDFELLQRTWQNSVVITLDRLLEPLASLTNRRPKSRGVLRRTIVKQACLTLLRTLYNKISNTTTKTLSFTLDTELNSDTLYTLNRQPGSILSLCEVHTNYLEETYEENSMTDSSHSMRERINEISRSVDSTVVLLALHMIPLSPKIDHSSLESDFQAWLFEWKHLWHIAKDRLLDALP
ncbi:hypothetical protein Pst134EA_032804 [Puccinia striiformis f. sp. tritici]|uniref:uncharacterized protein n=1 Tax=Puccinia striiformis f. sp. tritici TaxID=168172 RepID=UPI0020088A40|nr:uncharacterized protein Pst134EA_032804 [Puccinia striiformis f. sp. tritici]KAH9443507.1 hypothetical protein Pst134EA_032804 [Puccinia striiformis f. sp. tritici]